MDQASRLDALRAREKHLDVEIDRASSDREYTRL